MTTPQQIGSIIPKNEREQETHATLRQWRQAYKPQETEQAFDLFKNQPPASESDIVQAVRTLTTAFPNMGADFWALLTNRLAVLKFSKERLQYILHIAIDTDRLLQQYRYNRMTIADITSITAELPRYSYQQAETSREPMAWCFCLPDKPTHAIITTQTAARLSGYKWKPFER